MESEKQNSAMTAPIPNFFVDHLPKDHPIFPGFSNVWKITKSWNLSQINL
jgi:hypothetical protein